MLVSQSNCCQASLNKTNQGAIVETHCWWDKVAKQKKHVWNACENRIYSLLLTIEITKKNLHFFSSLRTPWAVQITSWWPIFATPWVPWQCEVLRNCAKDFWMPQSCENPSFNKSKPIFARAVCNAMGHALLDPHDAAWDIFSCEVLDNDSAFEQQHGKQPSTFKHEFAYILLFNLQSKHPQLCSADLNPSMTWNTMKLFLQPSRHCTKHVSYIWNLRQIMVLSIMKMGRSLGLHLSPRIFCFTSDWCVTGLFDVSYVWIIKKTQILVRYIIILAYTACTSSYKK